MNLRQAALFRTYFIRGHSQWFAYGISLINFVSIFYYLVIDKLSIIPDWFRFTYFILFFVCTYFPLTTFVGWYDYKKGTYRVEQNLVAEISPLWQKLYKQLDLLHEKIDLLENNQKNKNSPVKSTT
ncbi:MAG: hypothetical protein ACTSYA_02735 [Candidatus Kariarchaeaceae archaeon]